MIERPIREKCKCCNGTGTQQTFNGTRVKCPECKGTGFWVKSNIPPLLPGQIIY